MNQQLLISMSPEDLKQMMKEGFKEVIQEQSQKDISKLTYSISNTAKLLKRHHETVKKLICEGKLETTKDGKRVLAISLEKYLQHK
jgi:uncharacterized protein YaaW (UPF0174 family)